MPPSNHLRAIRLWIAVVIAGLVLSGVTAFPLETELRGVHSLLETTALRPIAESTRLLPWMARVYGALSSTNEHYPFLAYGTNWLAFAHLSSLLRSLGHIAIQSVTSGSSPSGSSLVEERFHWRSSQDILVAFRSGGDVSIAVSESSALYLFCSAGAHPCT